MQNMKHVITTKRLPGEILVGSILIGVAFSLELKYICKITYYILALNFIHLFCNVAIIPCFFF